MKAIWPWLLCLAAFSLLWPWPSAAYAEGPDPRYERLSENLEAFLGVPYVWGGTRFSGADCSGSLWRICRISGFYYPRTTARQMWVIWGGSKILRWDRTTFSDIVWWTFKPSRPFGHVGMVKDRQNPASLMPSISIAFYNASSSGKRFMVSRFEKGNAFDRCFVGAKRLE